MKRKVKEVFDEIEQACKDTYGTTVTIHNLALASFLAQKAITAGATYEDFKKDATKKEYY